MSTQLFFRTGNNDYSTGNNDARLDGSTGAWDQFHGLLTARGPSFVARATNTVAGPTNGVEVSDANGNPAVWYSPPLDANVTISGSITWNLRAAETNMTDNVAINGRIEVIDGATGAITLIDQTARVTELATAEAANNFAETPAAGVACKRGDRLRVRVFGDDAGTMGAGGSFTFWFNGPTAAASGDSYLTLTENLTFAAEPAGSQVFLTDAASDVATASVDKEAWTSRGAGVVAATVFSVAGWTAPIQVTASAGSTVVDWFTRQLAAFTLGGAVRCNLLGSEADAATNASFCAEVSVVDNDGTNAVVWAVGTIASEMATAEAAQSFLISGADLAVASGKRLRLRIYIDDSADAAMGSASSVVLRYAGTSGGASGDTYLTFSQTLTELPYKPSPLTTGPSQATQRAASW